MTQVRPFTARQGQTLFQPGQECPGFLDLTKGSIRVMLTGASGREVVLYRVRPGEVCLQTFSCLVDGHSYGAEGIVEADIEGILIPAAQFRQQLEDDASFRQRSVAAFASSSSRSKSDRSCGRHTAPTLMPPGARRHHGGAYHARTPQSAGRVRVCECQCVRGCVRVV